MGEAGEGGRKGRDLPAVVLEGGVGDEGRRRVCPEDRWRLVGEVEAGGVEAEDPAGDAAVGLLLVPPPADRFENGAARRARRSLLGESWWLGGCHRFQGRCLRGAGNGP